MASPALWTVWELVLVRGAASQWSLQAMTGRRRLMLLSCLGLSHMFLPRMETELRSRLRSCPYPTFFVTDLMNSIGNIDGNIMILAYCKQQNPTEGLILYLLWDSFSLQYECFPKRREFAVFTILLNLLQYRRWNVSILPEEVKIMDRVKHYLIPCVIRQSNLIVRFYMSDASEDAISSSGVALRLSALPKRDFACCNSCFVALTDASSTSMPCAFPASHSLRSD